MNQPQQEPQERTAELIEPTAVEAIVRAEVDISIATAHRFPRSIQQFLLKAEGMATSSPEIAASCEYKLKRRAKGGEEKAIVGPSIRMAEIVAATYGNLRVQARVISEGETSITVQGVGHDLESNVAFSSEVRRRIVGSDGRRYSEDLINQTINAACSIAQRNVIFRIVPQALIAGIIAKCRVVAIGDAKTLPARREDMLKRFKGIGISQERVLSALEVKGVADITLDKIADLHGFWTAIQDGMETAEELFPDARKVDRVQKDAAPTTPEGTKP